MNQASIFPTVRRSRLRFDDGTAAVEIRWPAHKTVLLVLGASALLWTAIIMLARAAILAVG